MVVESSLLDGVRVVRVADVRTVGVSNAQRFCRHVADASGPDSRVVIDAAGIEFFDSDGMDALIELSEEFKRRGGRIGLANVLPSLREFFGIVGVDWAFPIFENVPDAVAGLTRWTSGDEIWH